jgi:1-acyl-sn-glycerol-3-phosphate acyltransferase
VKDKYDVGTFSFLSIYSVLLFIFHMFSSVWLIETTVNVKMHKDLINVLNHVSAVLIVVMVSHMYKF